MKLFEIHITGDSSLILAEFEAMGHKTLSINLLNPMHNAIGYEYMCCIQQKFETYEKCLEFTLELTAKIKSGVARVKIESPMYHEYMDKAIYAEAHFIPEEPCTLPTVYNKNSKKFVSTERTYDKDKFLDLNTKYVNINYSEVELCLFDSNPQFDDFWLSHYKN